MKLSMVMEMLFTFAIQHGSHQSQGATEHLKCGLGDGGTEFLIRVLINLNLYNHRLLVATVLDNVILDNHDYHDSSYGLTIFFF